MKIEYIENTQEKHEAELLCWGESLSIIIGNRTHVINLTKDQWKTLAEVAANNSRSNVML